MMRCCAPNCRCETPCAALIRRREEAAYNPGCDGWEWCDGCDECEQTVVTGQCVVTARKARPAQGIEPGDQVQVTSLRLFKVGGPTVRRWRTYRRMHGGVT